MKDVLCTGEEDIPLTAADLRQSSATVVGAATRRQADVSRGASAIRRAVQAVFAHLRFANHVATRATSGIAPTAQCGALQGAIGVPCDGAALRHEQADTGFAQASVATTGGAYVAPLAVQTRTACTDSRFAGATHSSATIAPATSACAIRDAALSTPAHSMVTGAIRRAGTAALSLGSLALAVAARSLAAPTTGSITQKGAFRCPSVGAALWKDAADTGLACATRASLLAPDPTAVVLGEAYAAHARNTRRADATDSATPIGATGFRRAGGLAACSKEANRAALARAIRRAVCAGFTGRADAIAAYDSAAATRVGAHFGTKGIPVGFAAERIQGTDARLTGTAGASGPEVGLTALGSDAESILATSHVALATASTAPIGAAHPSVAIGDAIHGTIDGKHEVPDAALAGVLGLSIHNKIVLLICLNPKQYAVFKNINAMKHCALFGSQHY